MLRSRPTVKLMFVEIQLQAAMADGEVSEAELKVIDAVCQLLDFGVDSVEEVISRVKQNVISIVMGMMVSIVV